MSIDKSEPQGVLADLVRARRGILIPALAELGASNVRLFGSASRGTDGAGSDVDLLVDLGPDVGLFALGRMQTAAESILGVAVDVVPSDGLRPEVAQRAFADAVPL